MESKERLLSLVSEVGNDRYEYLRDLFKCMPEAIVNELLFMEVKKNEVILLAGEPCETVFIILKGDVIGEDHHKMGKIYSFMDFTRMYIIGDFEIYAGCSEYCVTIRAAEDCKLLKISANHYLHWIKHDENALFLRLNKILTTLTFERKLDREYLLMGCKERLLAFLTRFYEKEHRFSKARVRVEMTQIEIANRIGFNVRSVQRNISALEEEGLISVENGKIVITKERYLKLLEYEGEKERRN